MKIISKFKDYYDYLVGIYGEDDKLVLDRRIHDTYFKPYEGVYSLIIGDEIIDGYFKDNKFYWSKEDLDSISEPIKPEYGNWWRKEDITHIIKNGNVNIWHSDQVNNKWRKHGYTLPNIIYIFRPGSSIYYSNPILKNCNIQSLLSPEEIWIRISDALSNRITANEPKVPIGTDNIRIESHGFDLKKSFRPNIK